MKGSIPVEKSKSIILINLNQLNSGIKCWFIVNNLILYIE